jgi:hypothetical protein
VSTSTLTTANIQTAVTNRLAGLSLQNQQITVYKVNPTTGANIGQWTDAGLGDCIAVEIQGNFVPILPKLTLLPNPVVMDAKSVMYSEAN